MKRGLLYGLLFITAVLFFGCASQMRPVSIIDYQKDIGGRDVQYVVKEKKIDYDGTTVYGVPGENDDDVFGVIYKPKDDLNQFAVDYGNKLEVKKQHIEMVKVSDEKIASIGVYKVFFKRASFFVCLLSTLLTDNSTCFYLSDGLYFTKDENGNWDGNVFGMDFVDGKDIQEKIFVTNVGNGSTKTPFIIVETVPDYLEFKKATYSEISNIQKVTYDLHKFGDKQIVVFKVYPDPEDGFESTNQFELLLNLKSHPEKL